MVMEALLIDDHPIIQQTLPAMLKKAAGRDIVVHCAGDLAAALECAERCRKLALVVLDLGLPGFSGIDTLKRFRDAFPISRVVVLSASDDQATINGALRAGAAGYIPKTTPPRGIVIALKLVLEGGKYVPMEALNAIGGDAAARPQLSGRQLEVLDLMLRGLSNRQIAQELNIAESTVKQHASDVYHALGVSTRAQAMAAAMRFGYKAA